MQCKARKYSPMSHKFRPASTTPEKGKALYGLTLDVSLLVLTTLRNVARVTPVPYLMEAADLALGILSAVQSMKDCREGFKSLASDSCGLVYAIVGAHSEAVVEPKDMDIHVNELLETLRSIHTFSQKELRRNVLARLVRNSSDSTKILEYRQALRQSLDVFGLQSTVSIRENIAKIIKNQDEIVRQLERQSTQSSDLTQLLTETLGNAYTEKRSFTSSPIDSSPPSFTSYSKNPSRINVLSGPPYPQISSGVPKYFVTGNLVWEDKSHHVENLNSNNTVTTITLGSNNDSSTKFHG
ncbi:hypothetical protein BDZ94DRAFT_1259231 [Collybia nuda]|uniref:Uncharacterized protein n=1 Tax=Collybia nuda TaxID=64659 RepID=A0A9P6CEZ3_9AGAR|nr:hypothetical protein BDZ94DRAFT_1259231 [Collybia nuda]